MTHHRSKSDEKDAYNGKAKVAEAVTSDYLFSVDRMRGRLNLAVLSRERLVIAKFDGWPEVGKKTSIKAQISILVIRHLFQIKSRVAGPEETLRPLSGSKEERRLAEVVRDLSVNALRGTQLTINMETFDHYIFPVFARSPKKLKSALKVTHQYFERIIK